MNKHVKDGVTRSAIRILEARFIDIAVTIQQLVPHNLEFPIINWLPSNEKLRHECPSRWLIMPESPSE
jgi:hypothetical protein